MFALDRIIPRERIQSNIPGPCIVLGFRFYAPPEVVHEPGFAARFAGRINCFLPELQ